MTLALIGVNHKTAPIALREKIAIGRDDLAETTRALASTPGVVECMIVSTCNRVELLAAVESPDAPVAGFLSSYFGIDAQVLTPHLYEYHDKEAVSHLFRMAASLDSMVVGEPQILGQVKEAFAVARAAGTVSGQLEHLLQSAFAAAKKARSETGIGSNSVSIASVAVDMALKIFGSLEGRTVFLVGAGKMSEIAARHLVQQGAGAILVSNRTAERARRMAEEFSGAVVPEVIAFDQLYEAASRADIVISSTGAPHPIFRREHGQAFLHKRRNRPMFFIDIAVPRDVDPEMNNLDGIFVYDIDDLQQVAASHMEERSRPGGRRRDADRRGGGAFPPAPAHGQRCACHCCIAKESRRNSRGGDGADSQPAGYAHSRAVGRRRSAHARTCKQVFASAHAGHQAGGARRRRIAPRSALRRVVGIAGCPG